MVEQDFNSLVCNVINQSDNLFGWCYKIPDPGFHEIKRGASKRPLDLVGDFEKRLFFIESKLIKGFSAFNFNRIEDHQSKNLTALKKISSSQDFIGIFVAFWEPRTRYEFIFLDFELIIYLREKGVNSLHKKVLQKFRDEGYFIKIKKKSFNLKMLQEKRIDKSVFRSVIKK